jgi:hypothetical protein
MTRERENQLVSELHQIETRKRELIREIVESSLAGQRNASAISEMGQLSKRKGDITRPSLSAAA